LFLLKHSSKTSQQTQKKMYVYILTNAYVSLYICKLYIYIYIYIYIYTYIHILLDMVMHTCNH
jgi:hypothetical protein